MNITVREILESFPDSEAGLKLAAQKALALLGDHDFPLKSKPLRFQSSFSVAETHKLRKRLGYYNKDKVEVFGLEDTIASLSAEDVGVYLQSLVLDGGVIALWLSAEEFRLLGVITFRYKGKQFIPLPA